MNSTNKKALAGRGIPQPFNQPTRHASQFKPVVAQLKTAVHAQSVKRPVAPPVYRPQASPKAAQPKMATAAVNRKLPVAPPVYRPQPVPKVLQTKSALAQSPLTIPAPRRPIAPPIYRPQAKPVSVQATTTGLLQMKNHPVAPPVYRPQPVPKVLQTKKTVNQEAAKIQHGHKSLAPSVPGVRQPARSPGQPNSAATNLRNSARQGQQLSGRAAPGPAKIVQAKTSSVVRQRSSVVQRVKDIRTYRSWGGERIVVVDNGRDRISIFNESEREIGYLTYVLEVEHGLAVYEFGYILVQPAYQGQKLSSLLVMHLAHKALVENVPVIRVIKPDPGLAGYWQHIGFDFKGARKNLAAHYQVDVSEINVVPFADGVSGNVFRLNQRIVSTYWELGESQSYSHEESFYRRQMETLKGYNMFEGSVKPLHDYSSSYIS